VTYEAPDICHAHNLHGHYFDLRALPTISQQVPLVLSLHDAWLLTGHCAYPLDCQRWHQGCGQCPDLSLYPSLRRDGTAGNWKRKRDILTRCQVWVTTPSRWLMQHVQQSPLAVAIVEARVIPNGVDLEIFRPGDRRAARSRLNLPLDRPILLFAANGIRQHAYKDFHTLKAMVKILAERMPGVLFVALGETAPAQRIGSAEIYFVPYQADASTVGEYYRAADVYVHAARADTFPTTVLEALACGTPVIATAVGGIPEQVVEGQMGFLVPPGDAQSLATAVLQLLSDDERRVQMGDHAANEARKHFDLERQVDAYLAWYTAILESFTRQTEAGRRLAPG
jgi:glycosyltransferase involved in cell wall biosynthesis